MPKQEVPDDNLNKWGITSSQTASLASRKILYIGDMRKKSEGEMYEINIMECKWIKVSNYKRI